MKSFPLRPGQLAALAALTALLVAVLVGQLYGIALSVLLLATCALGLVIQLLWSSVRNLTGETPLTLDEALGLGAPSPEEEQKRAVLRALKDLEYERTVGKISEADYRDYSARYREEARRLMERVDASLAEARELAEKLVAERVAAAGLADAEEAEKTKSATPEAALPVSDDSDEDEDEDEDEASDEPDDDETDQSDSDELADESDEPDGDQPVSDDSNGKTRTAHDCPGCHLSNDPDAKFCKHCGAALESGPKALREKRARAEKTS